jgi:hypothetical protein
MRSSRSRASAREGSRQTDGPPACMELTKRQPAQCSCIQQHGRRTCSICGKCRSRSASETTALDQHICSRRRCAQLKTLLAEAWSSGKLAVDIHHHHHHRHSSNSTVDHTRPYTNVSELHGHASIGSWVELPTDTGHDRLLHGHGKLATIPEELPSIEKCTKPWRTL